MQRLMRVVSLRTTNGNGETWWCDDNNVEVIKTKCARFRSYKALVKAGRLSEAKEAKRAYNAAKCLAKRVVWQGKLDAEKNKCCGFPK